MPEFHTPQLVTLNSAITLIVTENNEYTTAMYLSEQGYHQSSNPSASHIYNPQFLYSRDDTQYASAAILEQYEPPIREMPFCLNARTYL